MQLSAEIERLLQLHFHRAIFRFLHFQFPFEFRSGLIKTNNDKNLIFFFGFSFIFFTVVALVVVAVAGSVSVLVLGPTPAAFA